VLLVVLLRVVCAGAKTEVKAKLGDEDATASFSSVKEELAAFDVEPHATAAVAMTA
jgi:hypothetical protein